jgi:uncharacterized protein with HEPN domain
MPPRNWKIRVEDIVEAIERIQSWTDGSSLAAFEQDERTLQAVAYNLLIIGEASAAIPRDVQDRYPDIPWSKMRAMRNVVTHEYFVVDPSILWQTTRSNLAPLLPVLRSVLEGDQRSSEDQEPDQES